MALATGCVRVDIDFELKNLKKCNKQEKFVLIFVTKNYQPFVCTNNISFVKENFTLD